MSSGRRALPLTQGLPGSGCGLRIRIQVIPADGISTSYTVRSSQPSRALRTPSSTRIARERGSLPRPLRPADSWKRRSWMLSRRAARMPDRRQEAAAQALWGCGRVGVPPTYRDLTASCLKRRIDGPLRQPRQARPLSVGARYLICVTPLPLPGRPNYWTQSAHMRSPAIIDSSRPTERALSLDPQLYPAGLVRPLAWQP